MTTTPAGKPARERGTGSVFQRADGRWLAVYPLGTRGGKRLRRTHYSESEKAARQWLRDMLKERRVRTAAEDRFTVSAQITEWLETVAEPSVRPSTLRRYRQIVKHQIEPHIGHVPLSELNAADVRRMLLDLHRGGLSAQSVSHVRAVLRVALELAVADQKIDRNPARYAKGPAVQRAELQVLGIEDARRLLTDCRRILAEPVEGDVPAYDRLAALYIVAIITGMRQGELLGLRWDDVDLEAGTLRIRHALQRVGSGMQLVKPKTEKSQRVISLPAVAVEALRAHRQRERQWRLYMGSAWRGSKLGDLVFTSTLGTPLSGPRVTEQWHRFTDAHELPTVRFHALRHSAASLLMAGGEHPRAVADLLGHSTTRLTLDTYSHVAESMRRGVADRMQAMLGDDADAAPG